jgi:hypothetical protein
VAISAAARAGDVGAASAVRDLIGSPDDDVRQSLARHLDQLSGRRDLGLLEDLRRNDPQWAVRLEAAGALARQSSAEVLDGLMADKDPDVTARAVRAVGEADRPEVFSALLRAATHDRPAVREAAAGSLGRLGLPAATPSLLKLADDAVDSVQLAAIEALGCCGDSRAVPALRLLAARRDRQGRLARRVLAHGQLLRLPIADDLIKIRVQSTELLDASRHSRIVAAFDPTQLMLTFRERSFDVSGSVDPHDVPRLWALVQAIDRADADVHGLVWSVRDGQSAIRQHGGNWVLSAQRGKVVRDAGWFDIDAPEAQERLALTPELSATVPAGSLPVSVNRDLVPDPSEIPNAIFADPTRIHDMGSIGEDTHGEVTNDETTGEIKAGISIPPAPTIQEDGPENTLSVFLEDVDIEADELPVAVPELPATIEEESPEHTLGMYLEPDADLALAGEAALPLAEEAPEGTELTLGTYLEEDDEPAEAPAARHDLLSFLF